ncbi:hypothetical protein [Thiomonas sp.]
MSARYASRNYFYPERLKTTPILSWPGDAMLACAHKVARFWGCGSDADEMAAEIVFRVIDYLNKRPGEQDPDEENRHFLDFDGQFFSIARYCKYSIIQDGYGPQIAVSLNDDDHITEIIEQEFCAGRDEQERLETTRQHVELFAKIGMNEEADFSLFDSQVEVLADALGQSPRQITNIRSARKKEIVAKAKKAGALGELNDLLSTVRVGTVKSRVEIPREGMKPLVIREHEYHRVALR